MTLSPRDFQFDANLAFVHHNQGLAGELKARSTDGKALLTATLASREPDCADEDRRACCSLSLQLLVANPAGGAPLQFSTVVPDYVYHGEDPGDHLHDLLAAGELLDHFTEAVPA